MKTGIVILILILCISLSACSEAKDSDNDGYELNISKGDKSLTLVLCKNPIAEHDMKMAEYTKKLMKDEGWDIDIKFYDYYIYDRKDRHDMVIEQLRSELIEGKNVIFEVRVPAEELIVDGLIRHIGDDEYPYYYKVGQRKAYYYTGVYVREDLEEEYGQDISSIAHYDAFLEWLSAEHTDIAPGLMMIDPMDGPSFAPLDLFVQANGFERADRATGVIGDSTTLLYIDREDILSIADYDPDVYQVTELPFFMEMDSYLRKWKDDLGMDFIYTEMVPDDKEYASIIMQMSKTTKYFPYDYKNPTDIADASGYNLHIFTLNNDYPSTSLVTQYGPAGIFAISSKSDSVDTITRFFDWVYESRSNYMLFMYGIEGIDYEIRDNRFVFLENEYGISYGEWYKHTKFLDMQMNVTMSYFPANWGEIESGLKEVKTLSMMDYLRKGKDEKISSADVITAADETVRDKKVQSAFNSAVVGLYKTYIYGFSGNSEGYPVDRLIRDIGNSKAAADYKKAYQEFYKAIRNMQP